KGVVRAKDTPNFIGNRIGTFSVLNVMRLMQEMDLTVEELRGLCSEAERQLTGEVRSTVWRLEEAVKRSTESLQQQGQPIPRFAEMSLKNDDCQSSPLVAMAVILL